LIATPSKSHVENVKAIRSQCSNIREPVLQVFHSDNDPLTNNEAKSLANNELGEFKFLVTIFILYDISFKINFESKDLQLKDVIFVIVVEKVSGVGAKAKTLPFTPAFVFLAAPTEAEEPARSTLRLLHYETKAYDDVAPSHVLTRL
jgi:hypothetical protein